jgi:hypothetical protein
MDYFLAYGDRFDNFLVYVATALLMKFSKRIKEGSTTEIRFGFFVPQKFG